MMFYVLLSACLLAGLGIALAAFYRPDTRRRLARVLAGIVAVAALWLLAFPPRHSVSVARSEAILLTTGYQPDTLRTLLRRLGPATRVWFYAPDSGAARPVGTVAVARLGAVPEQLPDLRYLHLLGAGLPAAVVPELDSIRLLWHTPPAKVGFQAAAWNRRLELGQPLVVEGRYRGTVSGPVWVRLQAVGATHDSVRLPGGSGRFQLRYTPKAAGRLVATVSAGPRRRPLAAEPIPAEVLPTRPLRVLLLAATPSFELKFLRNHLAARQHAVAWRTGISRGLTQTEFSNQPATDLSRLTPALLARYDVVVADAAALGSLAGAETQALRTAQRTAGLGLIVLAEPATPLRSLGGTTTIRVLPQPAADRPQRLAWPAAKALVPATLQLSTPARLLVGTASPARPVVAAQRLGVGTVVVSVLPETYPWLLQNETATYAAYWSRLLSAAARPETAATEWLALEPWPRAGLPVALQLAGAAAPKRPLLVSDAAGGPLARLALRQDALLPEWSTATYWPARAGWQQLERPGQPAQWLYVFGAQDWQGPEAQLRRATVLSAQSMTRQAAGAALVQVAWPAGWFVALFVLAAGFLWLEEKL
ncbi:hypothetical protein [Hymenobacter canadensis]|uniref:ABC-type uncharacterized transport system domain-containing protein n=1 Tax=Hymenobacter canadensis TaxID=2999067 RepID=A0ABY7LLN2_9BACT|nr:hypothetical protein [Hymenobacter canadensis]WBA41361.1 hypothetical protein O3303_16265 [Hymenobacter canadensis]